MIKNKKRTINVTREPTVPPTLMSQQSSQKVVKNMHAIESPTFDAGSIYSGIMSGQLQEYPNAPLEVPNGFATQIPFNTAYNSPLISNPTTIPMTDFWKMAIADPVAYASMMHRITSIVSRIDEYTNQNKKYQKHIRWCLQEVGEIKLKQSLATSLWSGISANKIMWANTIRKKIPQTIPQHILQLPPDSILLASTPEGLLDDEFGLLHYYYNVGSGFQQNPKAYGLQNAPYSQFVSYMTPQRQVVVNPMFLSAIPKDWRIIHTFNPIGIAGNHWGTSLLTPIYSTLMQKFASMKKLQVAYNLKSFPLVLWLTNTETIVDVGNGLTRPLSEVFSEKLKDMASAGMGVADGLNSIAPHVVDNTADLEKMCKTIEFLNHEIRTGLITANMVGNSGSFANAKVNSDEQNTIDINITQQIVHTMINQFVKPCLLFGFPNENIEDFGDFEIIDNSLNDQAIAIKIMEGINNLGFIDRKSLEDVNLVRKKCGLPTLSKLTDDIIMNVYGNDGMGIDMANAKSNVKEPYANGLEDHEKKFKG